MRLTIGHLYPDLLNLYGDRGNIECLKNRCEKRNIEVEIIPINVGIPISDDLMNSIDLLFMGGGEDTNQKELYNDFINNKGSLIKNYIKNNGVGLFICGGLQLLGKYYRPYEGRDIPGLGVLDLYTKHCGRDKTRCVGNVSCKITGIEYLKDKTLVGFENHGGRTYLEKETKPLAKILNGNGNNDDDKTEGVVYKNIIGTYLHGPLLPKNPHLADHLIRTALEKRNEKEIELQSLDDELEWEAHKNALKL
jgi:lipid II isoglutaminyl synthase (glutamine-hydrolysing)